MRRLVLSAAVATALLASACGAGGGTVGVNPSGAATPGSNVQDMRDIYALKKQVSAIRREQSPVATPESCGPVRHG